MKIPWKPLVLVLGIGFFSGAAAACLMMHYCQQMHGTRQQARERLYKKLKLTSEQKSKVNLILNDSHQKMDRVYTQTRSSLEEIRSSSRMQIRQLLTPDQQVTFDKMAAKMQAHFEKRFDQLQGRDHTNARS